MKYNKCKCDGIIVTFKPTMDADFIETAPIKVMMPKGWEVGSCHKCFFKPLGARCAKMLKTFCPIKVAK